MLKKVILSVSICIQVLLVGVLCFHIYNAKQRVEIIEDLFVDTFATKDSSFSLPFTSFIETSGVVVPEGGYLTISTPKEGVVDNIFVLQGAHVEEGAPLFKMKDGACYIDVKEKEEQLAKAKALHAFKKMGKAKYALLAKEKELEEIALRKEHEEKDAFVFKNLLEKMAVSAAETEDKLLIAHSTQKEYEKAKAEFLDLKAPMNKKEEAIYLHDIEEKKAALKQSTLQVENTVIRAPIAGTVVDVMTNKGEYLSENNATGILLAGDTLMVKVTISEDKMYKIKRSNNLKGVAVLGSKRFLLQYHSYNPKLSMDKDGGRCLELYFSFTEEPTSLYLDQSLKVYIEASDFLKRL